MAKAPVVQFVRASLSLAVAAGDEPPTEFRLFALGVNRSEKGDFLLDQQAAESVMAEYARHGKALLIDYNHATMLEAPTPEMAVAAGEFVPEVRADGLYAAQVKWTPRAEAFLRAKEYRFFSPTFEHDQKTGRVLRLINVALTNLPALDGIAPLVAANANATEDHMSECTQCSAHLSRLNTVEEECKALRAKLSAFEEKEKEKLAALSLRTTVLSIVGGKTDDEAIGVLQALKASHEELARVKGELAAEKATKLSADFTNTLDKAVTEGKVAPAQRAYWEGMAKEDGHEKAIQRLSGFVATAVTLAPAGETKEPATGSVALTENQKLIAKLSGADPAAVAKFAAEQAAKGVRI